MHTTVQLYTLVFVKKHNLVLLGMKKRGFGKGKWNGYGGKVEENESVTIGAKRELKEESNLDVDVEKLTHLGQINFENLTTCDARLVHIFTVDDTCGTLRETEEMIPGWFSRDDVPYEDMWPDSRYWLPLVLNDKIFSARFVYSGDELLEKLVHELPQNM